MKNKKRTLIIIFITLCVMAMGYVYLLKKKSRYTSEKLFVSNIKVGVKNILPDSIIGMRKFEGYNMEYFKNKEVVNVSNNKTETVRKILNQPNVFINFWYKGCGGCEVEMPGIQQFYDNYKNQIQFFIVSNDKPEVVQEYIKKNGFTMPFYVFSEGNFPPRIEIFPTSHLIINNKTQFEYAGVGYFDSDVFKQYIDSVLVKK